MQPVVMSLLLVVAFGAFAYIASRRWKLMLAAKAPDNRGDHAGERLEGVLVYMFGQARMARYWWAGLAHMLVFYGFMVLLLNSIILWVRGFDPDFDFWFLGLSDPVGILYACSRDVFSTLVVVGVLVFAYNRLVARLERLTLNVEGLVILGIIFAMMIADFVYEGGEMVRAARHAGEDGAHTHWFVPVGSLFALAMSGLPDGALTFLWHAGFWIHAGLVLLFLNLLPLGKHFHIITVLFNVYCRALTPRGRLRPIVDIEGRLEREETLGVKTVRDLSWKSVLDLYTCTECGRCTDHCPAHNTGKLLSPKHLTIHVRDYMYANEGRLIAASPPAAASAEQNERGEADADNDLLIPAVIDPETLWACTTCGACEQECPVFITYIDKIVDMRRNLAMEQGTFPEQLQQMFNGLERAGNPYSIPNDQRAEWAAGLDVPLMSDGGEVEYLYWVGCSASFDDRAKRIAQATANLLKQAGVKFAILGPEEMCNGDPARRAGNEYLFEMMARQNVEILNGYHVKKIVAACPHCFNTLKNEYPDFDGKYDVIHHTELLAQLIRAGRLRPQNAPGGRVVYHDACYLGRHNDIYHAPRDILRAIPGLQLVEAEQSRDRGMCCGAGGAQMWKEEEESTGPNANRVNHARTNQLLKVLPNGGQPRTITSACPFCKTMLSDSLIDQDHESVGQKDIAELLWEACRTDGT